MHVFEVLTGINLQDLGAEKKKSEEASAEAMKKAEEERKKREAEEEEKRKKEAEEALPDEEKEKLAKAKQAEAVKLEGNTLYKAKKFDEAIVKYSEAIALNPSEIIFYSNLAAVYMEMKEFDMAIAETDKGIEIAKQGCSDFSKLAKVMARRAACLAQKGLLDEAIE